jgi:hypothetical protein
MIKNWVIISFVNFFIASLLGLVLRLAHVYEIPWLEFRKVMYAHFHVSMLGWLYLVIYSFVWSGFIEKSRRERPIYNRLFWFTQFSVTGMIFSFSFQGFGISSVIFVGLHLLASYLFVILVWRDKPKKSSPSELFLRTSLLWMLLSTVGALVVAFLVIANIRNLVLYHMAIQFFLHFQFNGWFTFAVLAIFYHELERMGLTFNLRIFRWFFWLLIVSCALTYALSVAWSNPHPLLFFMNGTGVLLQLGAVFVFLGMMRSLLHAYGKHLSPLVRIFFILALISFIFKILIQSAVVLPQVAVISYTIRQFVVGFVHLTVLGSVSAYIVGLLLHRGVISVSSLRGRWGSWIFLVSFILLEIVLFFQGLLLWLERGFLPYYYETVLFFTVLFTGGILILLLELMSRQVLAKKSVLV